MCRKFIISGRVQGVAFRAFTRTRAEQLNIHGYAKNLADGRVEVVACGAVADVQQLLDYLWQGPSFAQVKNIEEQSCADIETTGFAIY